MKKGQMTIFIILGIVLVVVALLVFLINIRNPLSGINSVKNPEAFLQGCISPAIKEISTKLKQTGGNLNPEEFIEFEMNKEKQNLTYLCYTNISYVPCRIQEPMLIQKIKKEIEEELSKSVENCFEELKENFEGQGYTVEVGEGQEIKVELLSKKISVQIDKRFSSLKQGGGFNENVFNFQEQDYLYDLAIVAQEIISQEANYCNFEQLGFSSIYPEFEIKKIRTSNLDTIYVVTSKKSSQEFKFVTRSCVIPPGF